MICCVVTNGGLRVTKMAKVSFDGYDDGTTPFGRPLMSSKPVMPKPAKVPNMWIKDHMLIGKVNGKWVFNATVYKKIVGIIERDYPMEAVEPLEVIIEEEYFLRKLQGTL